MADRWHKLPSEIEAMDASALRLLAIVNTGTPYRNDANGNDDMDAFSGGEGFGDGQW